MKFPRKEPEIVTLALNMISGFNDNAAIYPNPPIATADLNVLVSDYTLAQNNAVAAQAAAEQATVDKLAALEALVTAMKSDIRYAETEVHFEDEKLKLIGWAGRSAPRPLQVPGQTLLLKAVKQGEGWLDLAWKAPVDGGKPAAYKVMRRERPAGAWKNVGTAIETQIHLADQERGTEFEYEVIASNKAGDGEESNMVMCVL